MSEVVRTFLFFAAYFTNRIQNGDKKWYNFIVIMVTEAAAFYRGETNDALEAV